MSNENINITGSENDSVGDSVLVQDQIAISRPPSPTLEQALMTYTPNISANTIRPRSTENIPGIVSPFNILSRVSIATAKYPNEATFYNYGCLQTWMFTHGNKRASIDICQSLFRMFSLRTDHYDLRSLFNLHLMAAETYQTVGYIEQANCLYVEAEKLANVLSNSIVNHYDVLERDRTRKKLEDVGMKLAFHSEFIFNFLKSQKRQRSNATSDNFLLTLDSTCNNNAEECRSVWRQIFLQSVINSSITLPGSKWLFSYAENFPRNDLRYANSLYVALNLLLFAHGPMTFANCPDIDIFKMLDDLGRYFEENGDQSKQFPPVHKMAHIWGAAAVAFHLKSDEYRYLVCACMMRVSFELLVICFSSAGNEPVYALAYKRAPHFFTMMANDPRIKLNSPTCINYFRRELNNSLTCIRYSMETVDRFVSDCINLDQTDHRI